MTYRQAKIEDKIIKVKISDIKQYAKNTKKHPDRQVEKIMKSIKEYGFNIPLVLDKNNEIICGHGRFLAAKKIGLDEVPCIIKDDLTPSQVKAFRIADNKVTESEWDFDFLKSELDELGLENFDLELTGFDLEDMSEINDFVGGSDPDEKYKTDKEPPKEILPEKEILERDMFETIKSKEKIFVQFSGGKDSMAQIAVMLDNGVPAEKMVIIHNSTPNDYPDLKKFVKDFSKKIGAADCIIIGNYTDSDAREIFKRNGFPLQHMVWCTSSWKIQPMQKFFRELAIQEDKRECVICQGWRKEESERRDNASPIIYDRNGFLLCRPIMDMKTEEVFRIIKDHGWELHKSYRYRGRLSCLYCFAIPRHEWDGMRKNDPENFFRAMRLVCHGSSSHNIKGDTFKNTVRKMMGMETMKSDDDG
jgi:3'-phosphoadenosine 5'-phosphosulfate sulfotransferase (PAPS reductase)/FAD synthetase